MRRTLLSLILAFSFAAAQAAGKPAPQSGAKPPAPVAAAKPAPPPSEAESAELENARGVFQLLLGEFALQRGEIGMGLGAYADLARRSRDPRILERAVEIAGFARQFDLALELSRLWVEVAPTAPKARQTLTTLLVLLNRTDELAPQIAALLEQEPANLADNLLRLNRMLARHTDRRSVQRLVDQVAAPYAALPEAHYAMASAAANANDMERAQSEISEALKQRPDWEIAALLRAQIQAQRSTADAIADLDRFVAQNPEAREARLALARLYIADKRYDLARGHFERLLKAHPDNPEVIYPIAMLALQQNDLATGKVQLEKLLAGDFPDKSTVHYFLGQIEEEQKHADAALSHYLKVNAGDQVVPARARAAQILVQLGKVDEARRLLRDTSARTDLERTQLTLAEAQMLRDAKRFEESYSVLTAGLAKQPDNTEFLYDAALVAERLGRNDRLEQHLQHLLRIKPDHPHGLNALGYSWAERNIRLDEAHALITRALSLMPDDAFIMDSLGWVLFRQGKHEDALKVLSEAYRRKADPEIAAHLGEVLWTLNRKDDARSLLRDAASRHPDNEVLAALLKKLQP